MFSLTKHLISIGYNISDSWDDSYFYGHNDKFQLRGGEDGVLQVGILETFNKWGDSKDFEAKWPKSVEEFNNILETVGKLKRCESKSGKYRCSNWLNTSEQHKIKNKILCEWHVEQLNERIRKKNKGHTRRHT